MLEKKLGSSSYLNAALLIVLLEDCTSLFSKCCPAVPELDTLRKLDANNMPYSCSQPRSTSDEIQLQRTRMEQRGRVNLA